MINYILSLEDFLFERNAQAIPSDKLGTQADTEVKEGTVVVLYNMLSSGVDIDYTEGYDAVIMQLTEYMKLNRHEIAETLTQNTYSILRNVYYKKKNWPPQKYFSYWLSSAITIHKKFQNFKMYRNEEFNKFKFLCARVAGVGMESWSRMDVILIRKKKNILVTLNTEIEKIIPRVKLKRATVQSLKKIASDQSKLNAINDLFYSDFGDNNSTKKNLVAISLKERSAQHGRANEFVKNLADRIPNKNEKILSFTNSIKSAPTDLTILIREIKKMRKSIESNSVVGIEIRHASLSNGDLRLLQVKYVAYKILQMLCMPVVSSDDTDTEIHQQLSLLPDLENAFTGMVAWVMNLIFSPPYYKVTGTGMLFTHRTKIQDAKIQPFWSGMKLTLPPESVIYVSDSSTAAGLVIHYDIALETGDDVLSGEVEVAIRTSGYENVDVQFRRLTLGHDF